MSAGVGVNVVALFSSLMPALCSWLQLEDTDGANLICRVRPPFMLFLSFRQEKEPQTTSAACAPRHAFLVLSAARAPRHADIFLSAACAPRQAFLVFLSREGTPNRIFHGLQHTGCSRAAGTQPSEHRN